MEFRPKEKDFSQTEKNDSYVAYLEESRKKIRSEFISRMRNPIVIQEKRHRMYLFSNTIEREVKGVSI
ncbi:hypothetical protein LEP1GSC038_3989 [Leptospira weilii str. 2006001855]|uniref:Uncharacterized protein n=1 Tax=Leptospira weilii str. 2006001855 TaxID=996804 RepID=M6FYB3_9LEPT|nr:hypothetical protein LEP1GSC038_3989 [Leptospira weilii str. 2006001855]